MMAKVMPSLQRSISPLSAKGPRANNVAGRALARAGAQLAATVNEIGRRKQQEHDSSTAEDSFNAFRDTARDSLYDHFGRKGAQAHGVKDSYQAWYEKESTSYYDKLENEQQRYIFKTLSNRRLGADLDSLSRHEAKEHFERLKSSTRATRVGIIKDAIVDPWNEEAISGMLEEGKVSINRSNPGKNNTDDIAQMQMETRAAVAKEMIAKDPVRARDTLKASEKWKDDLGTAYTDIYEKANLEATYIEATGKEGISDQVEFVKNSSLTDKSRRTVINRLRADKNIVDAREKERVKQTENDWFDLYNKGELTAEMIENDAYDYMSTSRRTAWQSKVNQQSKDLKTEADQEGAEKNRETHADWLERVDLNPHDYEPKDIYDAVDPNRGGLTGPQAANLVTRLEGNKSVKEDKSDEKAAKESIRSIKATIKAMHDRGDFGDLASKKTKAGAKAEKANHIIALEEWIASHPGEDPSDWYESYVDRRAAERAASGLNTFWNAIVPGEQKNERLQRIASGDMDESLARRMLTEKGYDVSKVSDEQIEQVLKTTDFNEYKTRLLTSEEE